MNRLVTLFHSFESLIHGVVPPHLILSKTKTSKPSFIWSLIYLRVVRREKRVENRKKTSTSDKSLAKSNFIDSMQKKIRYIGNTSRLSVLWFEFNFKSKKPEPLALLGPLDSLWLQLLPIEDDTFAGEIWCPLKLTSSPLLVARSRYS